MNRYPVTKPFFTEEETRLIKDTLDSGWVAQGLKVAEFEKQVSRHEGVAEGVATTSCTTALHLAMVTQGLQAGMDAIAPAFTFVATANAIVMTGATPVLCDIKRETFNIDVDGLWDKIDRMYKKKEGRLCNKVTGNILWGIVPVHEFGLCCDIREVNKIAEEYNLQIIEDAACALGAKIDNIHQGAFGNTSCISFHPRKSITTGEGGMILTDDSMLAKRMRELRTHGSTISAEEREKSHSYLLPDYNEAGYNYRMTDVQGAMGLAQIQKLDMIIDAKRNAAAIYNTLISEKVPELIPPVEPGGYFHTYQSYVCMIDIEKKGINSLESGGNYRNHILEKLEKKGISTRQGTHAVHMLGYYRNRFGYRAHDFENSYSCDRLSVTLPLYVGIKPKDQEYIVDTIRRTIDEL